MTTANWFFILINCLAGLALFLYGVSNMSDGMKAIASDKMKQLLGKSTNNIFAGILTGAVATTLLDSSSAVIIMVIAMINARVLSLRQSLGIILGCNIGTTIGCQIIAFDVGEYSAIPLTIGFIIFLSGKKDKIKQIGKSILGVGLIFFGLYYMGASVKPLETMPSFANLMIHIEGPYKGAFAGALATFIIQSSSATLGIVLSFANQGIISLSAAVAVMMGAEIGTCADTLFATLGRSKEAIRAGIFHLFFNIVSVVIGLLSIRPFIALVDLISGEASLTRHIANAHVLFNTVGVVLIIGFIPMISRILIKIIPEKESP